MECLTIHGGRRLLGSVTAGGSKNAALPIMAAALLADGAVSLDAVPRLTDVATLSTLLHRLGMTVSRSDCGRLTLQNRNPRPVVAPHEIMARMRASLCVLGPLLARRGRAVVALPGGCQLGPRPIDLHLAGLAALGAELRIEGDHVVARARRLRGATVHMIGPRGPSVTGTANVLCAATLARGTTVIEGAAREPEVVDLGRFLQGLGARIEGLGTPRIVVRGVDQLGGGRHTVIPDRIEAATLLLAGAITRGQVEVRGVIPQHLAAVLAALEEAGAATVVAGDRVTVATPRRPRAVSLCAAPYPGVPTDVQAQWMALVSLARGRSRICDEVFPQRFLHVDSLRRLGARIDRRPSEAVVEGVDRLQGAAVAASDLRAAAALVLAGLAARGTTRVFGLRHLDRGYDDLEGKLAQLGAEISRDPARGSGLAGPVAGASGRIGAVAPADPPRSEDFAASI